MARFTLRELDNGKTLRVPLGSTIEIELWENATTGGRWRVETAGHGELVVESDFFRLAPSAETGGGGFRQLVFSAVAPGEANIELWYGRSMVTSEDAWRRFKVHLQIG